MSTKILDKAGLEYLWTKLKAYFAPKAHTHNAFETKHSYTTAANAAKDWYRIANANTSQTDTTKPIHAQFILTAYNTSYDSGYYERWFVNAEVFGRTAHIVVLGNASTPFSQARILYENTDADLDVNDRPAIDIYLNYVLANGTTKIEIEEVYNSGWTFVNNGQISASTVPTGFENLACGIRGNGVERANYCDSANYLSLQRSNFTANITLADNNTYRSRILNCTNAITVTVPSLNSASSWFIIKNFNAASTNKNVTVHPSSSSVLIDDSSSDIVLKPGEWIIISSKAANSYSLIGDGRWKSQKMTRGSYERIQGTSSTHNNLNNYIDAGFYNIKTQYVDNCPSGIGIDAVLLVYPWNQGTYCTQELTESAASGDTRRWIRKLNGTAWSAWKQVAFTNTTLAGYGITDAKIQNGTITLGSNTITPLTADSVQFVASASRSADIAANGTFTVPSYTVGKQQLLVYLDGCLSRQDDGWSEVGTAGSASTTIKFLQLIPAGMEIAVRVN